MNCWSHPQKPFLLVVVIILVIVIDVVIYLILDLFLFTGVRSVLCDGKPKRNYVVIYLILDLFLFLHCSLCPGTTRWF